MSSSSVEIYFYIDTKGHILFSILIINFPLFAIALAIEATEFSEAQIAHQTALSWSPTHKPAVIYSVLHSAEWSCTCNVLWDKTPLDSKEEQQYSSRNLTVLQSVRQGLHRWQASEGQTCSWQLSFPLSFLPGRRYRATLQRASCLQEMLLTCFSFWILLLLKDYCH